MQNFRDQALSGKLVLLFTYPIMLPYHWGEWRRMRKLQAIVRKGLPEACRNPQSVTAEIVHDASSELRMIYGK